MDSTATGRPCVCILWQGGVSCPVSAAWHFCVAAHWSKYHCYKQAPSWYDLRCLKATLNPNKQTLRNKSNIFNVILKGCELLIDVTAYYKLWCIKTLTDRKQAGAIIRTMSLYRGHTPDRTHDCTFCLDALCINSLFNSCHALAAGPLSVYAGLYWWLTVNSVDEISNVCNGFGIEQPSASCNYHLCIEILNIC